MAEKPAFSFESYVVDQLEKLNLKMDGLNSAFVPREEIMLMKKQRDASIVDVQSQIATTQRETTALIAQLRKDSEAAQKALQKRLDAEEANKVWRFRTLAVAITSAIFIALASLTVSLIAHHVIGGA